MFDVPEKETVEKLKAMLIQADPVNSPAHYRLSNGLEVIDVIQASMSQEAFVGYLKGNILKYTMRAGKKDSEIQDYSKARWYENKLISVLSTKKEGICESTTTNNLSTK